MLQKENVKTLSASLFERVDRLGAPRLVEYWEQDPCYRPRPSKRYKRKSMARSSMARPAPPREEAAKVKIALINMTYNLMRYLQLTKRRECAPAAA